MNIQETMQDQTKFEARLPDHGSFMSTRLGDDWAPMISSPCSFNTDNFEHVMLNLIKNPNVMSSHLFRADVYYDSATDSSVLNSGSLGLSASKYIKHMKPELRPIPLDIPDFSWEKTIVRNLVPRNRQLDKDMVQTCHFYSKKDSTLSDYTTLVVYLPHISDPEVMPWYHPRVKAIAFTHDISSTETGSIAIHVCPFASAPLSSLQPRMDRTCLNLLQTIHKHGQGQKRGYQKRVHHDQVIPQQAFQDTYARLKQKYAKSLIGDWVEQTDPTKHVFEDLGIAAFMIELWRDMYGVTPASDQEIVMTREERQAAEATTPSSKLPVDRKPNTAAASATSDTTAASATSTPARPPFPGFVDIGCGNGVLVHILLSEGYSGWGFDARARKTWSTFPKTAQDALKELVLVPSILDDHPQTSVQEISNRHFHPGTFPRGTFIISNHADELTVWTPLLASLSHSPFIAIPCCSHDLSGVRFRAPPLTKAQKALTDGDAEVEDKVSDSGAQKAQGPETGSLAKAQSKKMLSAYATLVAYVASLAEEVGFMPEKEMLRIPSTRNACVVGRKWRASTDGEAVVEDTELQTGEMLRDLVRRELGLPIEEIRRSWVERAGTIIGKKGEGH